MIQLFSFHPRSLISLINAQKKIRCTCRVVCSLNLWLWIPPCCGLRHCRCCFQVTRQAANCNSFCLLLYFRMNHFKYSVGAPLHATEAFPTQQSQIQRFLNEVRGKWFLCLGVRKRRLQLRRNCNGMKMRTFVVFYSLINWGRLKSCPTFPVIIVKTLARFSFPPLSTLIWRTVCPENAWNQHWGKGRGTIRVFLKRLNVYWVFRKCFNKLWPGL